MELPGCPHHVPDDDTAEKKVTSSVEKARTGMRLKDPRLAQHCTRTWALPSPRGRPRRRICSCPSSAESGVSTQRVRPPESHREPRPLAPAASSARPRDSSPATRPAGRGTASGTPSVCHLHPWVLGRGDHVILPPGLLALHQLLHQEDVHQPGPLLRRLGFSPLASRSPTPGRQCRLMLRSSTSRSSCMLRS